MGHPKLDQFVDLVGELVTVEARLAELSARRDDPEVAEVAEEIERLTAARRDSLSELLEGWDADEHPEVVAMIRELARVLMADDDRLLADARSS